MIVIVYRFVVHPNHEEAFEQSWKVITKGYLRHAGSLGSRLHRDEQGVYWAYAQWPDQETRDLANTDVIPGGAEAAVAMQQSCQSIETVHTLTVHEDLLKVQ